MHPIIVSGILDPNESTTTSADYVITQADIDSGSLINTAIVSAIDMVLTTVVTDISDNGET